MPVVTKIVCLANSGMLNGRCIAGKEVLGHGRVGRWIRPVRPKAETGLMDDDVRYDGDGLPRLLDVIEVPLLRHVPNSPHVEDWEIDPARRWKKIGEWPRERLDELVDDPLPRFVTWDGRRISEDSARELFASLAFVRSYDATLYIRFNDFKRCDQLRCKFSVNKNFLNIPVTCCETKEEFRSGRLGKDLDGSYICISLGRPLENFCYKLAAGVVR